MDIKNIAGALLKILSGVSVSFKINASGSGSVNWTEPRKVINVDVDEDEGKILVFVEGAKEGIPLEDIVLRNDDLSKKVNDLIEEKKKLNEDKKKMADDLVKAKMETGKEKGNKFVFMVATILLAVAFLITLSSLVFSGDKGKIEDLEIRLVDAQKRASEAGEMLVQKDEQIKTLKRTTEEFGSMIEAQKATIKELKELEKRPTSHAPEPLNKESVSVHFPSVWKGGTIDGNSDGIDDRHTHTIKRNGHPITDGWVYWEHPQVPGKIAIPKDNKRNAFYLGDKPPKVRSLPFSEPNQRWARIPMGDYSENGEFLQFRDSPIKSVQIAWVVVEKGIDIPKDSPLEPQVVVLAD